MKRVGALLVSVLMTVYSAAGQTFLAGGYQSLTELFAIDPNEGLTVFLSTLIPMGGLAESMGMAYTAVALDGSFLETNPAASSVLEKTELSLFHNNWIQDTRIEGALYTIRAGRFGFAAGGKWLYVPFTERDQYGERVTSGYYSETIAIGNASVHLFPGYYFFGLAVGANLKLAYRAVPDYGDENGVVIPGSGASQSAVAIMTDVGLLSRFNLAKLYSAREKNFSVGLAIKNIGPPVLDEPLPTVVTLGVAYAPLRPMTFSFDLSQPVNLTDPSKSERLYWGAGTLVRVTDFLAMHGGLLIKGGNPRISLGSSVNFHPMTLVINWTADFTTQLSPLSRLSVQVRFDMGDLGRADTQSRVDDLYMKGLDAYARGETQSAVDYWRQALELDPGFDPARESMDAALKAIELQQRMLDIQKLE